MADPITLMAVGAVGGAMLNPNDPIKGALIGGTAGFTGGSALGAMGAAGSTAAGTTVGAGGIGGAAGGTGLTAATLGGAAPASAGLGTASGGLGLTATANPAAASFGGMLGSATPAAAGMGGGAGLLGTATGSMAAPFAAASTPAMLSAPMTLGGTPSQQLSIANQMLGRNQQAQQRMPMAPPIQSRPYTGMKQPVNPQLEEERRRLMYAMPQIPQIRLI
jgi:hypothetical protein